MSGVLRRYYALLDAGDTLASLDMLAQDLRFSILFSQGPATAQEFAGGRPEFDAYMAQRGAPTWTHHILTEVTTGRLELAFGETRQHGVPLATWVAAARLDGDGRIDRYLVGRSAAVLFDPAPEAE